MVNDIYSGRVVYSVAVYRSILADNYKPRAIEIYNPLNAPFLNHYRSEIVLNVVSCCPYQELLQASCSQVWCLLRTPQFYAASPYLCSVSLKFVASSFRNYNTLPFADCDVTQITTWELAFIIFASAFTLQEYTVSTEHGWISGSSVFFLFALSGAQEDFQFTSQTYVDRRSKFGPVFQLIYSVI